MKSLRWPLAAVLSFLVICIIATCVLVARATPPASPVSASADSAFTLVSAALSDLDGQPALALSFSQPLDPRLNYDRFIRVFKMPPNAVAQTAATPSRTVETSGDDEYYDEYGEPHDPNKVSTVSQSEELTELKGGAPIKGAWVVGENLRTLYFPHIEPLARYVVQASDTLPAGSASTLQKETRYSITTAAVAPAFYFASRGMVLPAKENGGLPVVTVNVPEVDVQFLRVRPEQMPRFINSVLAQRYRQTLDSDENAPLYNEINEDIGLYGSLRGAVYGDALNALQNMSDSVYQGRFLTEKRANKRSITYLPVEAVKELREPGVYIAVMSQPGRFTYEYQTTYYYVSDLGLHLRSFGQAAEAFVSSLSDGGGVSDVDITWLDRQGKVLARGKTDANGQASFDKKPGGASLILAQKGKQMSMIAVREAALDLAEFDVSGGDYRPTRLFAWSGRDLYRPGETFSLSVLARDADGSAVPAQPIQAKLLRADGKTQFLSMWQPMSGKPGYYQQEITLPSDAPTGDWTLELRNDPSSKQANVAWRFKVEEFLPERMKLDLSARVATLAPNEAFAVDVKGMYLYGAPAAGNRLLGVVDISHNVNPLSARFPGFVFGNSADNKLRKNWPLEEKTLDDSGNASMEIALDQVKNVKSPVTVRATLSLLETGGRPVVRNIERVIWPAPILTGVRPLFVGNYAPVNSPVDFEVIRVDPAGNQKEGKGMQARLFQEKRQYFWRRDDQRGWHSGYTETDELAWSGTVNVPSNARGHLRLPVRYGHYRLEIFDPETNMTQRFRFDAGWWNENQEDQRPDRATLAFDRNAYREGETARLTILSPHAGVALVTVDGDRTLFTRRVKLDGASGTVEIPIDKSWKRHDLYVSVMVLRPGNQGDNVTPTRALGLIHLPIARADRKLDVSIDAPERVKPETTVKVKVKAPALRGQEAVLTLSAVDVGILNITKFSTPDPSAFFFGKLRYSADLYDIYGRLIEKAAGKKGKLKWGGDGEPSSAPKTTQDLPKKVKLVDLFSGPVMLDANGEAEIPLALPDFNGTLRLSAVVADASRFGSREKEMVVAAPVIAELATPRYLNFNDRSTFALDVQNLTEKPGKFKVVLKAASGLSIENDTRELKLEPQQKVTLRYNVEAKQHNGLHPINISVDGAGISLKRQYALEVEAPTPSTHQTLRYTLLPGKRLAIRDPKVAGYFPESLSAHVFVSSKPPFDVKSAVQWLLQYPYGCAEQTTSSAYPWLFIDEEAARKYHLKPYTHEERAERVNFALGKLMAYQSASGSFSLWGGAEQNLWLSAYITGFLQDARAQGFVVPDAFYDRSMNFLLDALQKNSAQLQPLPKVVRLEDLQAQLNNMRQSLANFAGLARAGYVLARERKAPLSTLRVLFDHREHAESGLPLVELGIALTLMGDEAKGKTAIAEGTKLERRPGYWWWDYGSNVRDTALTYVLLHREKLLSSETASQLLARMQATMSVRYGNYSTQERLSIFRLGQALAAEPDKPWHVALESRGKKHSMESEKNAFATIEAEDFAQGIALSNREDSPILFVELSLSGHQTSSPSSPKDGEPRILLEREYLRPDGTPLPANEPLQVGDTVLVHLVARADRMSTNSALIVDRIPAGLEIENTNLVSAGGVEGVSVKYVPGPKSSPVNIDVSTAMADTRIRHVEFRDDRFVAATDLYYYGITHLFYRARVVTPGQYNIPPLYAEDMYRPNIYGILDPKTKMRIVDTGNAAPSP
jgi:uncharacterized protein YfaS (alpha-2-macroglobulin family)